jgi:hypothetical protein
VHQQLLLVQGCCDPGYEEIDVVPDLLDPAIELTAVVPGANYCSAKILVPDIDDLDMGTDLPVGHQGYSLEVLVAKV